MKSLHKYFMSFILEFLEYKYESKGEEEFIINIEGLQQSYERKYPVGQEDNKKLDKLNTHIIKGLLQDLKESGVIRTYTITLLPNTKKDGFILIGGFSLGNCMREQQKWRWKPLETENVLVGQIYNLINDVDCRNIHIEKNKDGHIKSVISEKYVNEENIKFVDLQKQYPHSTIEGVVFDGKIQYYKVVEKLQ